MIFSLLSSLTRPALSFSFTCRSWSNWLLPRSESHSIARAHTHTLSVIVQQLQSINQRQQQILPHSLIVSCDFPWHIFHIIKWNQRTIYLICTVCVFFFSCLCLHSTVCVLYTHDLLWVVAVCFFIISHTSLWCTQKKVNEIKKNLCSLEIQVQFWCCSREKKRVMGP